MALSTLALGGDQIDLGLPLLGKDFEQDSHLPIAQDWFASPLTVRERSMISLMLALKDKPDWTRKVSDEAIVAKWREEALQFNPDQKYDKDNEGEDPGSSSTENGKNLNVDGEARQKMISEEMFNYCIAELRENAKEQQERGFTKAIDANACVYMSDTAVSPEAKAQLRDAARRLETVKDWQKDWHPGSDGKVLDLVHPSLFPLLYGRSRVLPSGTVPLQKCAWSAGDGVVYPKPFGPRYIRDNYSDNFQWLPCEVSLDSNQKVKITSYINNLYPSGNEDIYSAVEDVITAAIPMWIETIFSTKFLATHRMNGNFEEMDGYVLKPEVIERRAREKEEKAERALQALKQGNELDSDEDDDMDYADPEEDDDYMVALPQPRDYKPRHRVQKEVFQDKETSERKARGGWRMSDTDQDLKNPYIEPTTKQLEDGEVAMEQEANRIRQVFQDQGLQVIVKLANIHLTPEKPTYDGGSWHIEGQLNEHIAASALYYYDSDNITDSYLAFREGVDKDELLFHEQFRYEALLEIYGIKDYWGNAIQVLGSVHTREDRLLVFPNVLQHRVSPFKLADPTRPGHRKLLALFLVDPFIRVPSTANIPPQQKEWWAKAVEVKGSLTQRLPVELADLIVDGVEDFPITLDEAKKLREELIEERKAFVDSQMTTYEDNGYCFCEH